MSDDCKVTNWRIDVPDTRTHWPVEFRMRDGNGEYHLVYLTQEEARRVYAQLGKHLEDNTQDDS